MTIIGTKKPQVKKVLSSLKDFQRDTVEYVFRRLYQDEDAVSRFLIADEVGLGKTLVARGIIAKAVDHLWDTVDRIDVVYICSNQDIARQNIDRLNITNEHEFQHASRATLLPIVIDQLRGKKLNFISLTPGTSFNLSSSTGWAWERAVLLNLLQEAWNVPNGPLKNVLRGDVGKKRWQELLTWFDETQNIDQELQETFITALQKESRLREQYEEVSALIGGRRKHMTAEMRQIRNRLLGDLRRLLASSSLAALEPDLVILDEFQRFKYLLDDDNEFALLAQQLFNFPKAKVLLLSATPYKMYTMHGESGENHYADFERTVKFLLNGRTNDFVELQSSIVNHRIALFRLGIDPNSLKLLGASKLIIEECLQKVMVRTEKLAVTADRNGMLAESCEAQSLVGFRDLVSFVYLDQISRDLNVEDQVEYWKSSSYPLNLMEGYKIKRKFESTCRDKPKILFERLAKTRPYLLDWNSIQEYQEIDPGNARMRALLANTVETGNWKHLWLPPALPYYLPEGVYQFQGDKGKTKTLIFSAWRIVPKVISVLLSYEVERRMVGDGKNEFKYSDLTTKRSPLLRFARSSDRLTGMSVFTMIYPCLSLALNIDPLNIARKLSTSTASVFYVWKQTQWQVEKILSQVLRNKHWETTSQVDERWYWAALLLLDAHYFPNVVYEWLNTSEKNIAWQFMLQVDEDDKESRFSEHVAELMGYFSDPSAFQLGKPPDDLVDVLTDIALAGPAVAMLRSLIRVTDADVHSSFTLSAAAQVGLGFRTLFNQPDAISLLQDLYSAGVYWQKALKYCVEGNLQAVLDEYTHVLLESLGLKDHDDQNEVVIKIGKTVRQALSIRAPSLRFDEIKLDEESKKIDLEKRGIRCRYALRFGDDKADDYQGVNRDTSVRIAFNSPFRPFVLATTSVGQEGLDFHQYCHGVVHWNLPSNPVDLEQREGRVHRYKGHVIRRNLASFYTLSSVKISNDTSTLVDPWDQLFKLAINERSKDANDLIPFWIFDQGKYKIDRYIPMLPLSSEIGRLKQLKKSLVVYRSVIGQPRQEELVQFLDEHLSPKDIEDIVVEAAIDLSPPRSQQSD